MRPVLRSPYLDYREGEWGVEEWVGSYKETLELNDLYREALIVYQPWLETLTLEYYSDCVARAQAMVFRAMGRGSNLDARFVAVLTKYLARRAKYDFGL